MASALPLRMRARLPARQTQKQRSLRSVLDGNYSPGGFGVGGQALPPTTGSAQRDDGCWRRTAATLIGLRIWRSRSARTCANTDVLVQPPLGSMPLGRLGGFTFGLIQALAPSAHWLHAPAWTLERASQRTPARTDSLRGYVFCIDGNATLLPSGFKSRMEGV